METQNLTPKERRELCSKLDAQFNGEVWHAKPFHPGTHQTSVKTERDSDVLVEDEVK
jgi:hypothetical protein